MDRNTEVPPMIAYHYCQRIPSDFHVALDSFERNESIPGNSEQVGVHTPIGVSAERRRFFLSNSPRLLRSTPSSFFGNRSRCTIAQSHHCLSPACCIRPPTSRSLRERTPIRSARSEFHRRQWTNRRGEVLSHIRMSSFTERFPGFPAQAACTVEVHSMNRFRVLSSWCGFLEKILSHTTTGDGGGGLPRT